jgi:hypothetical protein
MVMTVSAAVPQLSKALVKERLPSPEV